jgi:hypothetical protein
VSKLQRRKKVQENTTPKRESLNDFIASKMDMQTNVHAKIERSWLQ